jgi:hypothetical protein
MCRTRIRGPSHRHIQRHRVLEGSETADRARQHRGVVQLVIATTEVDDLASGLQEKFAAIGMRGQDGAIAGQREPERFGQAIHRVGGKHSRTRTAGGTRRALERVDLIVGTIAVAALDHRVDQVDGNHLAAPLHLAGFHRAAGDKYGRDIHAHCRHQHPRSDLVAVRNAHHRVGAVCVDHVFDGVGNQVTRRQRIKHAVVPHGNAVINGDGIEFLGDTAGGLDFASDQLSYILEMHVPRNELGERIDDGNDRLAEISVLHARGAPERARARHVAAMCRSAGTIVGHCRSPIQNTPEGGAI